eukprot:scpid44254/ scgid27342/ Serine/threonine-protein kinase SBK1; SH3-binding kinase 1
MAVATPPPPVPPPQPISTRCWSDAALSQRFRLQRRLGHGTYGTAWLARDAQTNELVVVKTVAKESTSRLNFKRELKYSHALADHPHVIRTRRQGFETDDSFILIQEYATGGDLFECIRPELGMDEGNARIYLGHICLALDYIHSRGLVHRDVKPENIVLCKTVSTTACPNSVPTGIAGSGTAGSPAVGKEVVVAKLIDFGLTRRIGSRLTRLRGSLPYTAPEMCAAGRHHNEDADESEGYMISSELDIWSLGITLFCMLTGTFPWRRASESDSNFKAFAAWQMGLRPTPPTSWRRFSPQLLELFSQLLCIDATRRATARTAFAYLEVPWSSPAPSPGPTSSSSNSTVSGMLEPQSPHFTPSSAPPVTPTTPGSISKSWLPSPMGNDVNSRHTRASIPEGACLMDTSQHTPTTAASMHPSTGAAAANPAGAASSTIHHQQHQHHRSSWHAKTTHADHHSQHSHHHGQSGGHLSSSSRRHSDSAAAVRLPYKVSKGCHTVKAPSTSQQQQQQSQGHRPRAKSLWSISHQPVSVT